MYGGFQEILILGSFLKYNINKYKVFTQVVRRRHSFFLLFHINSNFFLWNNGEHHSNILSRILRRITQHYGIDGGSGEHCSTMVSRGLSGAAAEHSFSSLSYHRYFFLLGIYNIGMTYGGFQGQYMGCFRDPHIRKLLEALGTIFGWRMGGFRGVSGTIYWWTLHQSLATHNQS